MKFSGNSIRILIVTLLFGATASLSGCAYKSCGRYASTVEYTECQASNGDQDAQYELGLAAYETGDMDEAVKWLKKAAKKRDNRTPIFIPKGNGEVRIQMEETGLSKPGHVGAQQLLVKIKGAEK